jgi:hypothetical protein
MKIIFNFPHRKLAPLNTRKGPLLGSFWLKRPFQPKNLVAETGYKEKKF